MRPSLLIPGKPGAARRAGRAPALALALAALVALAACGSSAAAGHIATPTSTGPAAGTLYLTTTASTYPPNSTTISALAPADGTTRWQEPLSGVVTVLVFSETTLYSGTVQLSQPGPPTGGTLTAITASSGAQAWHHDYAGQLPFPMAADADVAFVNVLPLSPTGPAATSTVDALRASDGSALWSTSQRGGVASAAVLDHGTLYYVTRDDASETATTPPPFALVALGASDGKPLWHLTLPGELAGGGTLVISEGVLYLMVQSATKSHTVAPSSTILAIKASDGRALWQVASPDGTVATQLLVSDGMVYYVYQSVSSQGDGLVALHASDGSLAWQKPPAGASLGGLSLLAAGNGSVFTVDASGKLAARLALTLHAYHSQNGAVIFEGPVNALKEQVLPSEHLTGQVANGIIYFNAEAVPQSTAATAPQPESVVIALGAGDGKLRWVRTLSVDPARTTFYVAP